MKKLFAILIMCSLSLPVLAIEGQEGETAQTGSLEVLTTEEVNELNNQQAPVIDEPSAPDVLPGRFKEPISKKKLAKKFIIAMLCVAGTSIFLYAVLSLYNKVRDAVATPEPIPPEGEKPLDSPADLTEAVKTFVEKTHWDN